MIFKLLDIDTSDVLTAAGTKWNFLKFSPGLVGGHCVGVDPYYLTYRAELAGYHPQVVLAGRRVNDYMGAWIAQECVKNILTHGDGRTVVILGATFKENMPVCWLEIMPEPSPAAQLRDRLLRPLSAPKQTPDCQEWRRQH